MQRIESILPKFPLKNTVNLFQDEPITLAPLQIQTQDGIGFSKAGK